MVRASKESATAPTVRLQCRKPSVRLKGQRRNVIKLKGQRPKVRIEGRWTDPPPPGWRSR
jgi:hypothetical protein